MRSLTAMRHGGGHGPHLGQVRPATVWVVGLNALALVACAWFVLEAATVLSWAGLALLLALALAPAVRALSRKLPRPLAVLLVYAALLGAGALLGTTLLPLLSAQLSALGQALPSLLQTLRGQGWAAALEERFHLLSHAGEALPRVLPGLAFPLLGVLREALTLLLAAFTVLTLSAFMLLSGEGLFEGALAWLPPRRRLRTRHLAHQMTRAVSGYVAGSFLLALGGGVVMAVALWALGVPWFLAVAAALVPLGLLPWVGAACAELLLLSTGYAAGGLRTAGWALLCFFAWQQLSHRLAPWVQAKTLRMNALAVALAMLVGTSLLGLPGTVLSVPLAGAAHVALSAALRQRQARWRHHPAERRRPPA